MPTTHPFDEATRVEALGDGRFRAVTSTAYFAFIGQFGGATAGALLNALGAHPEAMGSPVALTVNYAAALKEGPYEIAVRLVRANRSSQHWSLEARQAADPAAIVTATAVLATRGEGFSHQPLAAPEAPAWEALAPYSRPNMPSWVGAYEMRFAEGQPVFGAEPRETPSPARSVYWLADRPERPVDMAALASMADTPFGRVFLARGAMVPFGTVSLSTYFHVGADELAAMDLRRVLVAVDARRFHRAYHDHTAELFSPAGDLLAASHQIAYFKA